MFLPRIQSKDLEFEEANPKKPFHEITDKDENGKLKLPPCIAEKVSFMSAHEIKKKVEHPYAEFEPKYKHYKETTLKYPGHSFSVVPYKWMLKDKETKENETAKEYKINYNAEDEPDLIFDDQWVQHYDNQKALLDTFISAIEPDKSLVFIYAKNIPFVDSVDRILIGVGEVKALGELTEYEYSVKNPPFRSFLWERPVFHSIRSGFKNGFLLPYQELVALNEKKSIEGIDLYIARCPNFDEFSFGSELVSHDSAIDALVNLRDALHNCGKLLEKDYTEQVNWINDKLSNIWNMRGAFPGLGAVLSALKVPEGNLVAWEIEKHIQTTDKDELKTNPWDLVMQVFSGAASWLREDLQKQIGRSFKGVWDKMPEVKRDFLILLSRLAINNAQAESLYDLKESKKPYIENPYLLFENTVLEAQPILFNVVDKAVFPNDKIQNAFPVQKPSLVEELLDKRRVRALIIEVLEEAAEIGHSILTQTQVVTLINNRKLEKPCAVTIDILNYVEDDFFSEQENEIIRVLIHVDEKTREETKFYKLHRLQKLKDEIANEVNRRMNRGERYSVDVDWSRTVNEKFIIGKKQSQIVQRKQERANAEKAAALKELAESRFSILIGPAGTGKTTLLDILCGIDEIENKKILRLAPTGKARVNLGKDALTVAQFLVLHDRYDGETNRYFIDDDAKKFSSARTVIIDEASMLTEDQLAAVINTLVDVDRLILVGDPRQLPPIGTGKPFVDIINLLRPAYSSPDKPTVSKGYAELKEIFRQEEGKNETERIDVRLSHWFTNSEVRKGEDIFDEIEMHDPKDWDGLRLVSWYSAKELEENLLKELKSILSPEEPLDQLRFDLSLGGVELKNKNLLPAYFTIDSAECLEDWQILSPVNTNGFGTKELNRLIQKTFRKNNIDLANDPPNLWFDGFFPKRIPKTVGDSEMVYGDKVINLKNTKWNKPWHRIAPIDQKENALKYFANGEIGLITGEQRGDAFFKAYTDRVKQWKANGSKGPKPKLGEPLVNVTFSSQPGYSYQFYPANFSNGNDKDKNKVLFDLAYTITVHKSQGSGFEIVFLILPNPCGILSRELFYTALTRQKKKVIIFHQGDFKDFKKFIGDEWSETGRRLTDLFGLPALRQVNEKYYDAKYVQVSANGEFMISKSEVIIADHLFYNKIRYTYENAITDGRGITIHPDFTIEDRVSGITYYWEHLGLLTNDDYRRKWEKKLEWYRLSNISLVKDAKERDEKILIVTKDKPDGGIDSQEVLNIIQTVIKAKK